MYSPKIKENLVRELYQLKQTVHKPMTELANEAISEYLKKKQPLIIKEQNDDRR